MRPLGVVVLDADAEHSLEVAAVKNEQPIETFRANGADEALCDRVRLRRTHGSLLDPDAFAAEDLVEGGAVLAVAVTVQEADALVGEIETEVACLLGHPRAGRVLRAAGQPNASARMSDEEEHVVAAKHDALDCEERRPQRAFSRASRSTNSRTSADNFGRPRRPGGCRHFRRTNARCQRNSVRGVTSSTPREERGR